MGHRYTQEAEKEKEIPISNSPAMAAQGSGGDSTGQSSGDVIPGLYDDIAMDVLIWASRSDYPNLASVNKKINALISTGVLYKWRRQMGFIEQWVYLATSDMPWEAFDPRRRRWMRLPIIPGDYCFTHGDRESLAVGTELLVFGFELSGFTIWKYSLLDDQWSKGPLMNHPRCLFASGSLGEIAIVAGGINLNSCVQKSAELFNSESGSWECLPDMSFPRRLCAGFFMDGKFYVIGGVDSQDERLTCGEEFNMETRTWRRIIDMIPGWHGGPMTTPPLVAVVKNQLYAADVTTDVVSKYDKTNNTWNIVKRLPVRANNINGWGVAFKACDDKLLFIAERPGTFHDAFMLYSWCPEDGNEGPEWEVLSAREKVGGFVQNCAVMGC